MPAVQTPSGVVNFPDGVSHEEMTSVLDAMHPAPQQSPMASGLRNAFFPEQTQAPSILPVIHSNTFGITPEQGNQLRGAVGAQKQLDASTALQQRAQQEREIEAEKDRRKSFMLEKMRHDNQKAELEFKYRRDLAVNKDKALTGEVVQDHKNGAWYHKSIDPETKQVNFELIQEPPAPVAPTPKDYTLGNQRFSGKDNSVIATGAATPLSMANQISLRKLLNDVEGDDTEKNMLFDEAVKTGVLPQVELRTKSNKIMRTVTHEDGSQSIEEVGAGDQLRPPKPADERTLLSRIGKTVRDATTAKAAGFEDVKKIQSEAIINLLAKSGYTNDEIQQFYNTQKQPGVMDKLKSFLLGSPAPSQPTPQAQGNQFTGRDGKKYIDNGDGTATPVE